MDESPVPSFDDYFADLAELDRVDRVEIEFDTPHTCSQTLLPELAARPQLYHLEVSSRPI